MRFNLSWRKKNLVSKYGLPPDMARLAYDIHTALQGGGLSPRNFKVLGKFSLKCQTPRREIQGA